MNWKRGALGLVAAFFFVGCSSSDEEPTPGEDKKPEDTKPEDKKPDEAKKLKWQMASCRSDLRILGTAIGMYEIDNGKSPASLKEVDGKVSGMRTSDPWGNTYVYKSPGVKNAAGYDLYSLGPDGQDGTTDDVWKP